MKITTEAPTLRTGICPKCGSHFAHFKDPGDDALLENLVDIKGGSAFTSKQRFTHQNSLFALGTDPKCTGCREQVGISADRMGIPRSENFDIWSDDRSILDPTHIPGALSDELKHTLFPQLAQPPAPPVSRAGGEAAEELSSSVEQVSHHNSPKKE